MRKPSRNQFTIKYQWAWETKQGARKPEINRNQQSIGKNPQKIVIFLRSDKHSNLPKELNEHFDGQAKGANFLSVL